MLMSVEWGKGQAAADPVSRIPLHWYVVQTSPQRERLVQSQLQLYGYEVFYPHNLIHRPARFVRGQRTPEGYVECAYFSGYVFLGVRMMQPFPSVANIMGVVGMLGKNAAPVLDPGDDRPHALAGEGKPLELPKEFMSSLLAAAVPGACRKCTRRTRLITLLSHSCGLIGEIDDHPPDHVYLTGQTVRFGRRSPLWPQTAKVVRLDRHGQVWIEADLFGRATRTSVHHTQLGEVVSTPTAEQ